MTSLWSIKGLTWFGMVVFCLCCYLGGTVLVGLLLTLWATR